MPVMSLILLGQIKQLPDQQTTSIIYADVYLSHFKQTLHLFLVAYLPMPIYYDMYCSKIKLMKLTY